MRSVDQSEAAQADFVICCLVSRLPVISSLPRQIQETAREVRQRSTRQPCERCGGMILVDSASAASVPKICTDCGDYVRSIAARAAGRPS